LVCVPGPGNWLPGHPDTVEISDPMGVNAESVNFVTKTGIIIRVIELRVCALQRR
jgi:hypothetical protein